MEIVKTFVILFIIFQLVTPYQIDLSLDSNILTVGGEIEATVSFTQENGDFTLCSINLDPLSAPAKTSLTLLMFTFTNVQNFKITPKENAQFASTEKFNVVLDCNGRDPIKAEVQFRAPDFVVDGDPHFIQFVADAKTNKEERICYDVTGKSGDKIELFSHRISKTSVYGHLLDDYYMHIIEIISNDNNITITTKKCFVNGDLVFVWKRMNGLDVYRKSGFLIEMDNEKITVSGFDNIGKNLISFTIIRSQNSVDTKYLDIQINGLNDYQNIDGLFGRIGNNLFQFYDGIQNEKNLISNERGTIAVNGRFAVASKKVRYSSSCWLMNVKDALHPYPISKYVLEK